MRLLCYYFISLLIQAFIVGHLKVKMRQSNMCVSYFCPIRVTFLMLSAHVRKEDTWVCDDKSYRSWKGGLQFKQAEKLNLVTS